jgi:hypothetical protein
MNTATQGFARRLQDPFLHHPVFMGPRDKGEDDGQGNDLVTIPAGEHSA